MNISKMHKKDNVRVKREIPETITLNTKFKAPEYLAKNSALTMATQNQTNR